MADTSFEGAIGDISPRQLEFIGSVIEKHGFGGTKVKVEVVGKADDNYMASVKRITAEKDGETFKMIGKIATPVEQLREVMNTALAFNNEKVMYTEILPKFTDLEIAADVHKSERLRYAACYGYLAEEPNEVILLEDLNESSYVMLDRFKPLTDDTVKLILKNFARLHSLSYVLKHKEPETFNEFKIKLKDTWQENRNIEHMEMYFTGLENELLEILDNEKHKRPFRGLLGNLMKLVKKYETDGNTKYAVIIQGDPWTNNIMFQLEDDNPVECCMIDYQISRTGNPVIDLHYMILNCTDYDTRKKHYVDWIDNYHAELDQCLANFGLKANYVYPKDLFDADLKRYAKLGLATAAILNSVLIRESDDAAKWKEGMEKHAGGDMEQFIEAGKVMNLDDNKIFTYKKKMEDIVDNLIEFGYISE